MGVAGGTIERSCYSPHYVNTERDYERDYQATLPQGRTAADGCKPRHGRDDRKRERSFSGLRGRKIEGERGKRSIDRLIHNNLGGWTIVRDLLQRIVAAFKLENSTC